MTIRVEFSKSKSDSFAHAVRLSKQFKTFKEFDEEGLHIYSVEFDFETEREAFIKIYRLVIGWRGSAFFVDGKLSSDDTIMQTVDGYTLERACSRCSENVQVHRLREVCERCYHRVIDVEIPKGDIKVLF